MFYYLVGNKSQYLILMERNLLYRETSRLNRHFEQPFMATTTEKPYSGLDLHQGDSDSDRIYEGRKRTDVKSNPVRQLQNDLRTLGIGLGGTPDGGFGFNTECAVREFQIYAKMPKIALQIQGAYLIYGDTLIAVTNTDIYKGDIDGVVNSEVRRLIQVWLNNSWRIPVIVQAWTIKNDVQNKIFNGYDNIWKYDEVKSNTPRMYVKDLSGYYTIPTSKSANAIVLGDYAPYSSWGGPRSEGASRSWNETEITPNSLLGKSLAALSVSERSTFMVIRAVSKVECEGYLDRMNAYDNAFVSFGPFHWVLGLINDSRTKVGGGEVASYIAYLKEKDKLTFDKAFGFFGLDITPTWNTSGQSFFYSGGIRNYGKGRPAMKQGTFLKPMPDDKTGIDFGNYFRNWHWFYRFVMAARTIPNFTKYIWDFARLRIRDISSISIKNLGFTDSNGHLKEPNIAEIFTSERAFALILRLHVRYPAHVANLNNQDTGLNTILKNSLAQMRKEHLEIKDFSKWGQRHQEILVDNMIDYYPTTKGIRQTLETVRDFSYSANRLSISSNSFLFNSNNLSTPPQY